MNVDSRFPVGLVAVAIGVALLVGTGGGTYLLQMTVAEPVSAEVQSTSITTVACSVDESCRHQYKPVVTYRFTYGQETHTGSRVFPAGDNAGSRSRAETVASRYADGDDVTAYVVPGNPESAYLVKTWPALTTVVFGVFGLLLTLGGVSGIYKSLRGIEPADGAQFE